MARGITAWAFQPVCSSGADVSRQRSSNCSATRPCRSPNSLRLRRGRGYHRESASDSPAVAGSRRGVPRKCHTGAAAQSFRMLRALFQSILDESGRSAAWLAHLPWAQGVAGSNPAAPTTSLENLHNTNSDRELAESSAALAICRASPSIARFHLRVGPKVGPPESQLSDANAGGCWKPAAKNGHARRRAATTGGIHVRSRRALG